MNRPLTNVELEALRLYMKLPIYKDRNSLLDEIYAQSYYSGLGVVTLLNEANNEGCMQIAEYSLKQSYYINWINLN